MIRTLLTAALILGGTLIATNANSQGDEKMIERLNPERLRPPIHQSHVVISSYPRTAYFRASPYDVEGNVVVPNDFAKQAEQTSKNVAIVLEELGVDQRNIIKITAYVVNFDFDVHQPLINQGNTLNPPDYPYPSATLLSVEGLDNPGVVFELEVIVGLN